MSDSLLHVKNDLLTTYLMSDNPNIERIKELLDNGADINIKENVAFIIFYKLIKLHKYDIIEILLEHKLNPNTQSAFEGNRLIELSVILSQPTITQLLIKFGADVNVVDKGNRSPLDYSIASNNIVIFKELLPLCNYNTFKNGIIMLNSQILNIRIHLDIITLFVENDMFYRVFEDDILLVSNIVRKIIERFSNILDQGYMELIKLMISKIGIEIFRQEFTNKSLLATRGLNTYFTIDNLELLIQLGAKVDVQDPLTGYTPLIPSSEYNTISLEIVKFLVNHVDNKPVFINRESQDSFTALNRFTFAHIEIVKYLIENGGDINYKNKFGVTAFMYACCTKYDISYLITSGANVNIQSNNGTTALMLAVINKRSNAVKELLDNNADIFLKNNKGKNALDEAIKIKNKPIVTLFCNYIIKNDLDLDLDLDKYDAIINKYTSKDILEIRHTGTNVIANSLNNTQDDLLIKNLISYNPNIDTIKNLLENGANANIKIVNAFYTINKLMKTQQGINILKLLLEYKLNVNLKNRYNDSLIHAAVKVNNIDIVKLLIQNGADVNVTNNKNETPLINAITTSNVDIIKELLINCNIDTFINGINKGLSDSKPDILRILMEDDLFNKAFEHLDERIYNMVPSIIIKFLDNFSSIYMELAKVIISKIGIDIFRDSFTEKFILVDNYAIYASDNTIVDFLIELGAKVDIVSSMSGDTPLITSARNHYTSLEVVKSLVNNVEDKALFINKQNKKGDKALDLFLNSESSIIKFLIENGGDVNYKNKLGETFLMHACKSSFNISYLINKVTDIDMQSNIGETALIWAIKAENNIAVKILLDNKPNILLQTKNKENVLDIAIKMNSISLLKLLHEYIISNNVDITPEYKKLIESYIFRSKLRWKDACKSNDVAEINKYKKLFNIKKTDIKDICSKLDDKEQGFKDYKMKVINKCINSEDLLGDDLKDMYPENFYSYKQNGITYCEDIRTMFKLVNSSEIVRNPFTREVLSASIIQDIKDKYKIYNIISNDE